MTILRRNIERLLQQWLGPIIDERMLHYYRVFGDKMRLSIATTANVQNALFNTVSGSITVGENTFFGHDVAILTGSHDPLLTGEQRKAYPSVGNDIDIGAGVWIASRAVVLGPCRVGAYSVVAAGAVVRADVPPYTLVAGVPARPIRFLSE
jgi:acetyltransferase-like isoleucine patch superfamily enzyme